MTRAETKQMRLQMRQHALTWRLHERLGVRGISACWLNLAIIYRDVSQGRVEPR